jgi:hypothetical protein
MKLKAIHMVGFRRFLEPADIPIRSKLTALIGPNEAGKSTVLKAMMLAEQNRPIDSADVALGLFPHHTDRAKVTLRFEAEADDDALKGDYHLRVSSSKAPSWGTHSGEQQSGLEKRRPRFLLFERALREAADIGIDGLHNSPPPFWRQLYTAIEQDPRALAAANGQAHIIRTIERAWNARLERLFRGRWAEQSSVYPQVVMQGNGIQFQWRRGDSDTPGHWGSEGLRTYWALVLFLEAQRVREGERPVILLVDELEQSLHYSAQAEVVRMLQEQKLVKQVIYTTHSAGCLPGDIGRGVVALEAVSENESRVKKRIWNPSTKGDRNPDLGAWPLLMALGAGPLGFLAIRRPVFVEGFTDLIYLPEALRWASGEEELDIDFYPGLAQACERHELDIARRGRRVAFLLDGDEGGRGKAKHLEEVLRVAKDQLVEAPYQTVEDLIEAAVFREVLGGLLGVVLPVGSETNGQLMAKHKAERPSKEALAYDILERAESGGSVWREDCRESLRQLLDQIRRIVGRVS